MIPSYERPPTIFEQIKSFISSSTPFWLLKIFRFLIYVIGSVLRFLVNLLKEAANNLTGKY